MRDKSLELERLVHEAYGTLMGAEPLVLRAATAGELALCGQASPDTPDLVGDHSVVRSSLIRWLCVTPEAASLIDVRGLRIHQARFLGQLDLAGARISFRLAFSACTLEAGVSLNETELGTLSLSGCICGTLDCDGLVAKGGVFLRDGFQALGGVLLVGASINGDLDCSGSTFQNTQGPAILAKGARIDGDVFFDDGFEAREEVRLVGATIHGNLSCRDGRFLNPDGTALQADRVVVGGSAFLDGDCRVQGRVSLVGASVAGNLSFRSARLERGGDFALVADRIRVAGNILLDQDFTTDARIRLSNCQLGGHLDLSNACFVGPHPSGLTLENGSVQGNLSWQEVQCTPRTQLDLAYASVGQLLDDAGSWPEVGYLRIDGFLYKAIAQGPIEARVRLEWLRRQPAGTFNPQPFEQLIRVLRDSGHEDDALEVAIAKQDERLRTGDLTRAGKVGIWLMGWSLGHGYKPYRALIWSALVISIGTLQFEQGYRMGAFTPASDQLYLSEPYKSTRQLDPNYPKFNSFMYAMDTFLPIIELKQEEFWLPNANQTGGEWLRWYLWGHIALGWLLSSLAVAGFSGVVRTD